MIDLVGVYNVTGHTNAHLLEFKINAKHTDIDIGGFTQQLEGIDRMEWQTPWDEKYLNEDGTEITGDWLNKPNGLPDRTRLAFFFHFLDFETPMETPFGEIGLKQPELIPDRLQAIIVYEEPD